MLRFAWIALFCVFRCFPRRRRSWSLTTTRDLVEQLRATGSEVQASCPVTEENVMTEIADADAYVGEITSAEVRAAKEPEVGCDHECRRGARSFPERRLGRPSAKQHHPDEQQNCAGP